MEYGNVNTLFDNICYIDFCYLNRIIILACDNVKIFIDK